MMYRCSFIAHFNVCIMVYARAPHDRSGRGSGGKLASAAESGSMKPIRGSAGKDVFCWINPENPGRLAGMSCPCFLYSFTMIILELESSI